jgi:hypothetical protein
MSGRLDPPKRSPQALERWNSLLCLIVQDVAHPGRDHKPAAFVNVSAAVSQWPLLRCR